MNPILNPRASKMPEKNGSPVNPSRRTKPGGRDCANIGVKELKPRTVRSGMRVFCSRIKGAKYAGISSGGESSATLRVKVFAEGVMYLPTAVRGSPVLTQGIR